MLYMKMYMHVKVMNQIGIILANFLISFFAEANVLHSLIDTGAKFQPFMPSFMKVLFESSVKLFTGNISFEIDPFDLTSGPDSLYQIERMIFIIHSFPHFRKLFLFVHLFG